MGGRIVVQTAKANDALVAWLILPLKPQRPLPRMDPSM